MVLKRSIKALEALESDYLLPGHGDIISGNDRVRSNFKRVEEYWFKYI
jgi:hypothetical protein